MTIELTNRQRQVILTVLDKEWDRLDQTRRRLPLPEDQYYLERQIEIGYIQDLIREAGNR